jgi:hypothetical protein
MPLQKLGRRQVLEQGPRMGTATAVPIAERTRFAARLLEIVRLRLLHRPTVGMTSTS